MSKPEKSILDALWCGDLRPFELNIYNTPERNEVTEALNQCQAELEATMTAEQITALRQCEDYLGELEVLSLEILFKYAFRLGARMMLDVMSGEQSS